MRVASGIKLRIEAKAGGRRGAGARCYKVRGYRQVNGGGHGLSTYATLERIEGKAAKGDGVGWITTLSLRDFLAARVARHLRGDLDAYPPWFWK